MPANNCNCDIGCGVTCDTAVLKVGIFVSYKNSDSGKSGGEM